MEQKSSGTHLLLRLAIILARVGVSKYNAQCIEERGERLKDLSTNVYVRDIYFRIIRETRRRDTIAYHPPVNSSANLKPMFRQQNARGKSSSEMSNYQRL